jgi:hypothetical protein
MNKSLRVLIGCATSCVTLDAFLARAAAHGTSTAEQIRLLIEWGLEAAE